MWVNSRAVVLILASTFVFSATAAIYGHDDRQDIYQVPSLAGLARATAVAVPNLFVTESKGSFSIEDVEPLSDAVSLCPGERFFSQPSLGVCSGVLIDSLHLITAGHCVLPNGIVDHDFHPFCEGFSWYFDYNLKKPGEFPVSQLPSSRLYRCRQVVRAENWLQLDGAVGNDFAVIELDRPVTDEIRPVELAAHDPMGGAPVFTIGHPSGMPAKYSGTGEVLQSRAIDFVVNLDTLGGNSGGPVFDVSGQLAGILVSGHQFDYVRDPSGCMRPNVCDDNGDNCLQSSRLQKSNFVQKLAPILPYLPRTSVATWRRQFVSLSRGDGR